MKNLLIYATFFLTVILFSSCDTEVVEIQNQEGNLKSAIIEPTQNREVETETAYIEWVEGTNEDQKRAIREDLIIREFLIAFEICEENPNGEVWVYCEVCRGKPKVKVQSIPNHSRFVPRGNCYEH